MSSSIPFPFARFTSLLGVHTTLLLFTALYLPRSSFVFTPLPPQASSTDRPQHPFVQPLTADPLLTLAWLCVGVAVIQVSWASWMKAESDNAWLQMFGEDEEARIRRAQQSSGLKFQRLKDALTTTLAATVFIHVVVVLFGAPLISHFYNTYLLAVLLSILVVYPAIYVVRTPSMGSDTVSLVHRMEFIRIFVEFAPKSPFERLLVYPAVSTLVGAWVGTFPIALDWDRPWQAWPLTPAYGAIAGHILGSWGTLLVNATFFLAETNRASEAEKVSTTSASGRIKMKSSTSEKRVRHNK